MLNRFFAGVLLLVLMMGLTTAASADEHIDISGSEGSISGSFERRRSTPGSAPSSGGSVSVGGGSSTPSGPRPVITRDKRGITYDYSNVGGGKMRYTYDPTRDYCHGSMNYVECFGPRPKRGPGGGRPAPAPPPVSPEEIVEQTIVNVRLPQPDPSVDPGYAVTGMKAYLETGNSTTHRFEPINTVLGPLTITASSTYTVNWGDGEITGPYSNSGGAYPNGRITHVYRHARTVDIVVTQNWTAQWSLAGQSGTITGLSSSGTLADFLVREVQAVRRR